LANIEEKVQSAIEPQIKQLGYKLYDIEYVKEGKDYFLRIYIDNDSGIGLEDCEKVSGGLSEILDKQEYLKEQYFLEVSSPGIERVLRKDAHLEESIGKQIEIKLFKPYENKKTYTGILNSFTKEIVRVSEDNKTINLDRKLIAHMKILYNWD
jgi:ribosome maturation factor RimP